MDPRAALIRLFTFLGGIYFFLYFVLPESALRAIGITEHHEDISNGFIVVGAMAVGLGLINIVSGHGSKVVFKRPGWFNSLALLLGLVSMLAVTAGQWWSGVRSSYEIRDVQMIGEFASRIGEDARNPERAAQVPPLEQRISALVSYSGGKLSELDSYIAPLLSLAEDDPRRALSGEVDASVEAARATLAELSAASFGALDGENVAKLVAFTEAANRLSGAYSALRQAEQSDTIVHRLYTLLYTGLFNQLGSAMFALLGVYIAAAAYRAFRVKTVESALMMAAAVIVMLGQISAVFLLVGPESFGERAYTELPTWRQWLLEVPNSAAFRAIRLGAGVAGLMLAIRMWLSIESSSFGAKKGS